MRALFIVIGDPGADPLTGFRAGLEGVQVDALVFQGSPEALDHPIIDPAPAAVHRDLHLGVMQYIGEVGAGELRALVGVEYLRRAVSGQRPFSASTQNPASIEFDSRQFSTFRLCQSITATRYRKPRRIGI